MLYAMNRKHIYNLRRLYMIYDLGLSILAKDGFKIIPSYDLVESEMETMPLICGAVEANS